MAAADAVSAEMLKAFDESDATKTTEISDAQPHPDAEHLPDGQVGSPELACAVPASAASASGEFKPGTIGTWLCSKCKLLN